MILQIPIHDDIDDFIAWHCDKKGIFSVKSAYKVAVDSRNQESLLGMTSSSNADNEFNWKKL